jgi:hypothetical protein
VPDKDRLYRELVESGAPIAHGGRHPSSMATHMVNGGVGEDTTLQHATTSSDVSRSGPSKNSAVVSSLYSDQSLVTYGLGSSGHRKSQLRERNASAHDFREEIRDIVKNCIEEWEKAMKQYDYDIQQERQQCS